MASSNFNYKLFFKILGGLLLVESFFLLVALTVGLYYKEDAISSFIIAIAVAVALGIVGLLIGRKAPLEAGKREGSVIVTFTWILFTMVGMIPFLASGSIANFTDAFFETMSGFSTTGASILMNIEEMPFCILFWRSLTQWIGGLGIIVITMALLPLFGFTSVQLFAAEATGPTKDKIHPKISETAKRLFLIYVILTVLQIVALKIAGMTWFDSVCHSFTTIATGGFSTKQASIAYWDSPLIEYIIIFFMVFSGVNFSLYYFLFKLRGKKVFKNEELRYYFLILILFTILISISNLDFSQIPTAGNIEKTFRESLFMVSSIITTTGYTTYDYMQWMPFTWIMLLILMLSGASAGSTSGGIKVVRVVLVAKYCYYEFKRMIHPNAVLPVRYNGHIVRDDIITRVLAFVLLYCILTMLGILVLSFSGLGFMESVSGMITCLSDVGPGLGEFGPAGSFANIPSFTKWFLSFVMLVGRLELFTVLLILTPAFWKR
ncbi:TrkH family potassium uptake protein [Paludibacter sp. 221]|uniref:TrkH family potassium uptake protein n=1 Tax=Paludibacter sp. 221 TaxID=2302939 RepID=UPI0013D622A7|nr:TrkH family potassium uptake protein [Paludibacter sp. 221]NDV46174.1 TrkH family potassium uptake protein [Paludibacter sp. 221]